MAAALAVYGTCQSGCNAAWVACYAAAGLVAGTVTAGVGMPAAALVCNSQQGICMASCAVMTGVAAVPEVATAAAVGGAVTTIATGTVLLASATPMILLGVRWWWNQRRKQNQEEREL